jgi:hypothetical protein
MGALIGQLFRSVHLLCVVPIHSRSVRMSVTNFSSYSEFGIGKGNLPVIAESAVSSSASPKKNNKPRKLQTAVWKRGIHAL